MICTPKVSQKNLTFGGAFSMAKYSNEQILKVISAVLEKCMISQHTH